MANTASKYTMNNQAPEACLKEAIRLIIETAETPTTEYKLIRLLNDQGWALSLDASDSTILFNTHFVVYHALYELQVEYWAQQRFLDISALFIGFKDINQTAKTTESQAVVKSEEHQVSYDSHQALRDYYLDLSHCENATEDSVNELLNQFWSRFIAEDDRVKALNILKLPAEATLTTLKQRYRSLAMEHHPDRGGEAEQFQQINWAFGVLQKCLH